MASSNIPRWLEDDAAWGRKRDVVKIDVHHHFVPEAFAKAVEDAGGDPAGWKMPEWSAESSLALMDRMGTRTAILSLTTPGACILKGEKSYKLARHINEVAASVRDKTPDRFGFFATLPSVLDTEAAIEEIRYALDDLKADGVTLFTRYGEGHRYLGHPDIEPIWKELGRRRAVVFVHPTNAVDTVPFNDKLPQPIVDFPHETCKAATDLIMNGTMARNPGCKVILSHAGGTLPFLINRVTTVVRSLPKEEIRRSGRRTYEEMMQDFKSFYYDLALSTPPVVVEFLKKLIPREQILFGSDFPYAPPNAYPLFLSELELNDFGEGLESEIYFKNAIRLLPRVGAELNAASAKDPV